MLLLHEEFFLLAAPEKPSSFVPQILTPRRVFTDRVESNERAISDESASFAQSPLAQLKARVGNHLELISTLLTRNKHTLWDSSPYFSHLRESGNQNQSIQRLKLDLTTFFHEYVGMFWKKIYPYSKFGIFDGYDVPMSELGKNFEQLLKDEGRCTIRASLETLGMKTFEEWSDDESVPIGEALMYVSPRGSFKKERYPGRNKNNYVFVNIFQKIGPNKHQLIQYTSFDLESDLEELQLDTLKNVPGAMVIADPNQEMTEDLELSHQIIARKIKLGSGFTFQQIEEMVYKNEADWPTKRKELPKIDEAQFGLELSRILIFCEHAFLTLAGVNSNNARGETAPHLKKFTALHQEIDINALPIEAQFDVLITSIRKKFLKWTQDHSSNYHGNEITFSPLSIDQLIDHWHHECLAKTSQLETSQKTYLKELRKSIALDPALPLMRLSSLAHCIAFTPHSLALNMVKIPSSGLGVGATTQILQLSALEKAKALTELQQKFVQKNLFGQRWYILCEQSHEYTEQTCSLVNGIVMGPCDIPLADDQEFCMSGAAYDQLFATLSAQNKDSKLDSIRSIFDTDNLTHDEKTRAKQFVTFLETLIRHSAGLLELINSDFYSPLAHQVISAIQNLPDPLQIVKSPHSFVKKIALLLQDIDETLLPLFISQELHTSPT